MRAAMLMKEVKIKEKSSVSKIRLKGKRKVNSLKQPNQNP